MAIQVGGTTVIDNSRNLSNVGGLKTINGTSILGSGNIEAGASTGFGDVGTYSYGRPKNTTNYTAGDTNAGITVRSFQRSYNNYSVYYFSGTYYSLGTEHTMSGTWRAMTNVPHNTFSMPGLWVRIS